MKRFIIAIALVIVGVSFIYAQPPRTTITSGATLPANCTADTNLYGKTGTDAGFYFCTATNTWSFASFRSGGDSNAGSPNYTAANSGLIIYDVNGVEVWRLWASDPNFNNFNTQNLYLGGGAGAAQPSDNSSAGYANTGIGYNALFAITTGTYNTALGRKSMQSLTSGGSNTAIGPSALNNLTSGSSNVAVGDSSLFTTTTGANNVAIGVSALLNQGVANDNTMIGTESGINVTTGGSNTGVGRIALGALTTGTQNVAVGHLGGQNITTGGGNVSLGDQSGVTTGTIGNSIALGTQVNVSASNRGVIGNSSVTDVYFGSETAAANINFATALPTVGYKSTDGSPGITSATCTAWKNGLCVTP